MSAKTDNRICIRLPLDTLNEITLLKEATGTTTTAAIRFILKEFFNKNEELLNNYYTNINNNEYDD